MPKEISRDNIHTILKSYFPNRFHDLSPSNFENLVRFLLDQKFDSASTTKKSGDYGADVIAFERNTKIIVEVKRYGKKNKVGNNKVNNLIAAKKYYDADKCIFITTSDFTTSAITIANKSDIELWNWNQLTKKISDTLWEGKSYFDFYDFNKDQSTLKQNSPLPDSNKEIESQKENDFKLEVRLKEVIHSATANGTLTNWIKLEIENKSDFVLQSSIEAPKVVNHQSKQFDVDGYETGHFQTGEIFPGAIVQPSYYLHQQKAGKIKVGTQIFFTVGYQLNGQVFEKQMGLSVEESHIKKPLTDKTNQTDLSQSHTPDAEDSTLGVFLLILIVVLTVIFIVFIASK